MPSNSPSEPLRVHTARAASELEDLHPVGLLTEALFRLTLKELPRRTIPLATDRRLPSVTTLVTGEPTGG
ncbi:MAG: hypothetical protein LN412_00770 [Candidatus Thermoplasmatota archaeon]|nr:hypothetical protein [Candidatus Thermoplasmatota archaeon]